MPQELAVLRRPALSCLLVLTAALAATTCGDDNRDSAGLGPSATRSATTVASGAGSSSTDAGSESDGGDASSGATGPETSATTSPSSSTSSTSTGDTTTSSG